MSSYKGHSIFAFLLACMFFHNPLLISLTLIGANIPDFDHKFKKDNVYKMIILGLIIFISLYILKLPYYIGLIIVFLGITFYFSEHRSFTHSLFGVLTLTAAVSLILIWALQLITIVTTLNNHYLILAILISLLSFLFLNKKLLMVFLPIFFISLFVIKTGDIAYTEIVLSLLLGIFSHIVLDSFTPSGIKLFAPLSSKKVYKNFGLTVIFILAILSIFYHASSLFKLFEMYIKY
ncbi:MAG: metal-dependent hydrolase [archaeon]|uniref:Inner membrane protein n=1 Tax=Methanobrevibacter gottschalkii DSM 11977 TaxID=1122229 RepID=A0A3N5B6G9_9EURY|nr:MULTISPECIES: metal-dependent hydrolase [Methanobrevibacter]MCQ2970197.1 metal-dependent hydrolase [archaeon]OEC93841.1 hydrolase [Methanobrevibacter sp. A27]RPF52679.1 inner membrane protein [Methanobrevibacter gottschalkii DSM 11977]